jgi:hypothetical protein
MTFIGTFSANGLPILLERFAAVPEGGAIEDKAVLPTADISTILIATDTPSRATGKPATKLQRVDALNVFVGADPAKLRRTCFSTICQNRPEAAEL